MDRLSILTQIGRRWRASSALSLRHAPMSYFPICIAPGYSIPRPLGAAASCRSFCSSGIALSESNGDRGNSLINSVINSVSNSNDNDKNKNVSNSIVNKALKSNSNTSISGSKRHLKSSIIGIDTYLFGESDAVSFSDLGVQNQALLAALDSSGYGRASLVQAKAIPAVLSSRDVVIGSETGSGKTLAYAVPVLEQVLGVSGTARTHCYPSHVVFVPNKELANQVFKVFSELISKMARTPRPIKVGIISNTSSTWPFNSPSESPDVVVCVPAVYSSLVRGPKVLDSQAFSAIRTIVYDEADLLFDGSYKNELQVVLDTLKVDRRAKIAQGLLKVHEPSVQHVLSAATIPSIGKKSVQVEIQRQFPNAVEVNNEYFHVHHPRIVQKYFNMGNSALLSDRRVKALIKAIREHSQEKVSTAELAVNTSAGSTNKQISLVEVQSIVSELEENHATNTNAKSAYFKIDNNIVSTMIFVNTSKAAAELAATLRSNYKISCVEFHKDIKDNELRSENLRLFQEGREKLMICTDQVARGLDMSFVRHVIQAEFALNVVSHLHRIGRASRAGKLGYASNFYDESSKDLVDSLINLESKNGGNNLDISSSFSRKRGFRQRLNRRLERQQARESKDKGEGERDATVSI